LHANAKGSAVKEDYPIVVTAPDFDRLRNLRVHRALGAELDRAVVLRSSSVPPDLVTMNSRLIFEDESTGERREIAIVYPQDADASKGNVSVLAPVGTALLGLSTGQSIVWPFPDGSARTLQVISLLYQPEAAEDAYADHG
jgi:regulator of nucleoside diphosphate kinase